MKATGFGLVKVKRFAYESVHQEEPPGRVSKFFNFYCNIVLFFSYNLK